MHHLWRSNCQLDRVATARMAYWACMMPRRQLRPAGRRRGLPRKYQSQGDARQNDRRDSHQAVRHSPGIRSMVLIGSATRCRVSLELCAYPPAHTKCCGKPPLPYGNSVFLI